MDTSAWPWLNITTECTRLHIRWQTPLSSGANNRSLRPTPWECLNMRHTQPENSRVHPLCDFSTLSWNITTSGVKNHNIRWNTSHVQCKQISSQKLFTNFAVTINQQHSKMTSAADAICSYMQGKKFRNIAGMKSFPAKYQ